MTRARLLQLSNDAYAHAERAMAAGEPRKAVEWAELGARFAAQAQAAIDSRSPNVQATSVTAAQAEAQRRGRAIAKVHATNALLRAIAEDDKGPDGGPRWGSGRVYARKRLGIAPSSFTGYMDGTTPCPKHVDKKVRADFPKLSWTWPRPPVD